MFWLGLFLLAFLVLNGYLHLGVQGKEGELRPDRSFGVLTLFLALLGLVGHLLSASERFLFAPDIGVMMYEGSDLQRAGLYLLLIGVVFFGALVPETVRSSFNGAPRSAGNAWPCSSSWPPGFPPSRSSESRCSTTPT